MKREGHNFFLFWLFHLTPPRAAPSQTTGLASASSENRLASSKPESQLPLTQPTHGARSAQSRLASLFSNPPNPHRYRAWRQSRPRFHFQSGIFIVTSLIVTSTPLVNTCTQLTHALTNPCTKWKVLSLTKPKGKIYKTKNDNIKKNPPQLYYRNRIAQVNQLL